MDSEQRHRIRGALLDNDATLIQAYRTSATFKNALDSFTAMLPSMVLGLAGQCLKEDGERHRTMLDMMKAGMTSRIIRPEDLGFVADQEKPGIHRDADV